MQMNTRPLYYRAVRLAVLFAALASFQTDRLFGQDASQGQTDTQAQVRDAAGTNKVVFVRQIAVDAAAKAALLADTNSFPLGSKFIATDGTNKVFIRRSGALLLEPSEQSTMLANGELSPASVAQGQPLSPRLPEWLVGGAATTIPRISLVTVTTAPSPP
jgi:hypothetical protein